MTAQKSNSTASFLRRRILRHNLIQIGCIAVLVPGSIWAWLFSYSLPHGYCVYLLQDWFNLKPEPFSTIVAWAVVVVLAAEGVRRGIAQWRGDEVELADVDEEALDYCSPAAASGTMFFGGLGVNAHMLVYVFLLAPLCVLKLIQCCRSISWPGPETFDRAAQTVACLAEKRDWMPVAKLGSSRRALHLLYRLRLIWCRYRAGEACVCIATTKSESP